MDSKSPTAESDGEGVPSCCAEGKVWMRGGSEVVEWLLLELLLLPLLLEVLKGNETPEEEAGPEVVEEEEEELLA